MIRKIINLAVPTTLNTFAVLNEVYTAPASHRGRVGGQRRFTKVPPEFTR